MILELQGHTTKAKVGGQDLLLPGAGAGTGLFAEEEDLDAQAVSFGYLFGRWQLRRVNLPNADACSFPFLLFLCFVFPGIILFRFFFTPLTLLHPLMATLHTSCNCFPGLHASFFFLFPIHCLPHALTPVPPFAVALPWFCSSPLILPFRSEPISRHALP